MKALDFAILVPGHGDIQHDAAYADLLIEAFELVAVQIKPLIAEGLDEEAAVARLDFSSVEPRFTEGDEFLAGRFDAWFKRPIGRAAYRVESGDSPEVE
ncbi:hypothetical protein [Luteimonas suaedae]|uniref:hypothetical protein n=1 Tax=Luteimonas suaedae TaxID=2605430 RepID=UPI001CA90E25|nr:hypothetical protein [Luteimonas suaedae]